MFVWPRSTFGAENGLEGYEGDTVVYVGESDGCTADIPAELIPSGEWKYTHDMEMPNWDGIRDFCGILRRVTEDIEDEDVEDEDVEDEDVEEWSD
ncbi:hypothetical protein HDV00_006537 [Rhizophlyctis rosea]|nr:hypothetical protein HDV00_006537 [Rhizophlyctis rosea]